MAQTVEDLQQRRSGCKRGSIRYRRLSQRIARIKAHEARQRREELHLLTTGIAREFLDIEIIAPRSIKEATASGHGDERSWGAATEIKAEFNRHVLDQSPALAIQMLEYKIAEGGGATNVERAASIVDVGNELVATMKRGRQARRKLKKG